MAYEFNGFKIDNASNYSLKVIKTIGKGSLPDKLKGLYTSSLEAERAVTRYLTSKEKASGKTNKSS